MLLLFLLYETQIETFEKFKEFKAAAEKNWDEDQGTGSDRGGEHMSDEFS